MYVLKSPIIPSDREFHFVTLRWRREKKMRFTEVPSSDFISTSCSQHPNFWTSEVMMRLMILHEVMIAKSFSWWDISTPPDWMDHHQLADLIGNHCNFGIMALAKQEERTTMKKISTFCVGRGLAIACSHSENKGFFNRLTSLKWLNINSEMVLAYSNPTLIL